MLFQTRHNHTKLEDHRLRQLGQRLIYWNAPALVSEQYATAAQEAIRDRWLSNDPDALWTTMMDVDKQLEEIADGYAVSDRELKALRRFYRIRAKLYNT